MKMNTEKELRKLGAVWHEAKGSIDPHCKRGWYLPHDGAGLSMRSDDLARQQKYQWGIFLGANDGKALEKIKKIL